MPDILGAAFVTLMWLFIIVIHARHKAAHRRAMAELEKFVAGRKPQSDGTHW